ncbi:MAG: hypothetical protein V7785_19115 [Bermanella sp.]
MMQKIFHSVWLFASLLLTASLGIASESVEKSYQKNGFTMDVAVNIVGVEAAARELSDAMQQVALSINAALQSDKLSSAEHKELLAVLSSFKGIEDRFSLSLKDAREPINNIVADANQQFSQSAHQLNKTIVEPFTFKFQLLFYIFMGLIAFIILGIIIFIKVYVLGALNRASSSATNLVNTLDNLPSTIENIVKNVETEKTKQQQPRFIRNISNR